MVRHGQYSHPVLVTADSTDDAIIDSFKRFCPVLYARFTYRGADVVAALERTCGETGYPHISVVTSAFLSHSLRV